MELYQKIENITTFGRLCGYVKFFYPSDESLKLNWDRFILYGIAKVQIARNSDELKNILSELFEPIAPALQMYSSNSLRNDLESQFIVKDSCNFSKQVYWQYLGLGQENINNAYRKLRVNGRDADNEITSFTIYRSVPITNMLGTDLKVSVYAKVFSQNSRSNLWIKTTSTNNKINFVSSNSTYSEHKDWEKIEVASYVDSNTKLIEFGYTIIDTGTVLLDKFELKTIDKKTYENIELNKYSFENIENNEIDLDWLYSCSSNNCITSITNDYSFEGTKSLLMRIQSTKFPNTLFDYHPQSNEYLYKEIGSGISCILPISLCSDEKGTLPRPQEKKLNELNENLNRIDYSNFEDSLSCYFMKNVIISWNVLMHFYPYREKLNSNWENWLKYYIEKSYLNKSIDDNFNTIEEMLSHLNDGHASVSREIEYYYPPFITEFVEGKVVIAKILDSNLSNIKLGNIVLEIDGENCNEKIKEKQNHISASTEDSKIWKIIKEELFKGSNNSVIKLKIMHDDKISTITTKRKTPLSEYFKAFIPNNDFESIKTMSKGCVYVNLMTCKWADLSSHILLLKKAKGVIFDLRGYPEVNNFKILSYLTDSVLVTQPMYIPEIIYPDFENVNYYVGKKMEFRPMKPRIKSKIIFLTDGRAISQAETILSIVKNYKLGAIVGQPTAGTNGNINQTNLSLGFSITWTGMKVLNYDNSSSKPLTIYPDYFIMKTRRGIINMTDEYLDYAIKLIDQ